MPRRRVLTSAAALLLLAGLPSAQAQLGSAARVPTPVFAENLELVGTFPDVGAISTAFDPNRPFMYVNTLNGVTVYDISTPEQPVPTGVLPLPHFENERMTIGSRGDETFVLIGYDLYAASTEERASNVGGYQLTVVDVSDPTAPVVRGSVATSTSVHTVHCIATDCQYAYSAGAYDNGKFSIIDLTDLDAPKEVQVLSSVAGSGHQWDYDDAGYLWHSGFDGVAAYDVSDPLAPVPVASTNKAGVAGGANNDFILHNAFRPGAEAFEQAPGADGRLVSGSKETASPFDGNVLLATEEDYDSPDCQGTVGVDAPEGGFQTWYVPYLDAEQYAGDNPAGRAAGLGAIEPLDTWNTELLSSGVPTPVGALCSAHYFTYKDGFVAQAWYGQGTRILDVRDPRDIKQVGYFFTGASETWISYFVPARDEAGKIVPGEYLDLVYTNDVVRGIDVLRFTAPGTAPEQTTPVVAPVLPQWTAASGAAAVSVADIAYGAVCRVVDVEAARAANEHVRHHA